MLLVTALLALSSAPLPERLPSPAPFLRRRPPRAFRAQDPGAADRYASAVRGARLSGAPPPLPPLPPELACRLYPKASRGSTRKFYCTLPGGELIKVKYGADNPEVVAELAAARLVEAAGFAADPVFPAARVRCFGCDADPFVLHDCLRRRARPRAWEQRPAACPEPDYERYTDFVRVAVERRDGELPLPAPPGEGVGWIHLEGLPRPSVAERDALRLLLVLLQHWDDGPDNQRLVCRALAPGPGAPECADPQLVLADLGASFGSWRAAFDPRPGEPSVPARWRLQSWRQERVFIDPARCIVARPRGRRAEWAEAPRAPQTVVIHEEGRLLLLSRLRHLGPAAREALFRRAWVAGSFGDSAAWGQALGAKLAELERARCPAGQSPPPSRSASSTK